MQVYVQHVQVMNKKSYGNSQLKSKTQNIHLENIEKTTMKLNFETCSEISFLLFAQGEQLKNCVKTTSAFAVKSILPPWGHIGFDQVRWF
jgi:hypothetical protein